MKQTEQLEKIRNLVPELDPNGIDQHSAGAKLDANKPNLDLVFKGFANALLEVGKVGTLGAEKYSPNGWKQVENGLQRYSSAMLRHYLADDKYDRDTQMSHLSHLAWNALAMLQLELENK